MTPREFLSQFGLTRAQINVAEQVILGKSNRDAADALCIAERTVKFHLCTVYKKLFVKTRCELIFKAYKAQSVGSLPMTSI